MMLPADYTAAEVRRHAHRIALEIAPRSRLTRAELLFALIDGLNVEAREPAFSAAEEQSTEDTGHGC